MSRPVTQRLYIRIVLWLIQPALNAELNRREDAAHANLLPAKGPISWGAE